MSLVELRDDLREIREQLKSMTKDNELEPDSMMHGRFKNTHHVVLIPMNPLIVLNSKRNGVDVSVLNGDRCNKNVSSNRFVKNFRHCFKDVDNDVLVQHPDNSSEE